MIKLSIDVDIIMDGWEKGWATNPNKPADDEYLTKLQAWMDGYIEKGLLTKEITLEIESEIYARMNGFGGQCELPSPNCYRS